MGVLIIFRLSLRNEMIALLGKCDHLFSLALGFRLVSLKPVGKRMLATWFVHHSLFSRKQQPWRQFENHKAINVINQQGNNQHENQHHVESKQHEGNPMSASRGKQSTWRQSNQVFNRTINGSDPRGNSCRLGSE